MRACCSSIRPVFRSASMAICLPGIASKVKRAATSATRSAPLVMTINCTITIMKKIIKPITTLPLVISWPKAAITSPAKPSRSIIRVEDTLRPRRNRVVIRSSDGYMENSSVSFMFMVISSITMDRDMFITRRMSRRKVGRGRIRNSTTTTTNREIELFSIRFIYSPPFHMP